MSSPERPVFIPQNLEFLNAQKPSTETMTYLKEKGYLHPGSPYWWSTDYAPDPRVYLDPDEFLQRLTLVKKDNQIYSYVYEHPQVPMTVLTLPIDGHEVPCMVTIRPFHPSSVNLVEEDCLERAFCTKPLAEVANELTSDRNQAGRIRMPRGKGVDMFFPHVRGVFVGARGNTLFWYIPYDGPDGMFIKKIYAGLKAKGLGFVNPEICFGYSDMRRYERAYTELSQKGLIYKKPFNDFDIPWNEISIEELLNPKDPTKDYLTIYPLRLAGIEETLPLVISTRTHKDSTVKKPTVLFMYCWQGRVGASSGSLWRISNREFAQAVSNGISRELQTPIDCVLYTPPDGRKSYKRISPSNVGNLRDE